jgi:hypothetical protein
MYMSSWFLSCFLYIACPFSSCAALQMEGMVNDLQLAKEREKQFEGGWAADWLVAWLVGWPADGGRAQ